MNLEADVGNRYLYTIQALEFGRYAFSQNPVFPPAPAGPADGPTSTRRSYTNLSRCGSCSSAEKDFLTGEELTVQGKLVCAQNDWNLVKVYYIQGIKGLLTVYNREVARVKRINLARNLALTGAVAASLFRPLYTWSLPRRSP